MDAQRPNWAKSSDAVFGKFRLPSTPQPQVTKEKTKVRCCTLLHSFQLIRLTFPMIPAPIVCKLSRSWSGCVRFLLISRCCLKNLEPGKTAQKDIWVSCGIGSRYSLLLWLLALRTELQLKSAGTWNEACHNLCNMCKQIIESYNLYLPCECICKIN